MSVKVKEIDIGVSELEAIIAGLRLLAASPEETWSQYMSHRDHLEELILVLKTLDATATHTIRCTEGVAA